MSHITIVFPGFRLDPIIRGIEIIELDAGVPAPVVSVAMSFADRAVLRAMLDQIDERESSEAPRR